MKKIKIALLGVISVAVLSFSLNSPIVKKNAAPTLKQEITVFYSEHGTGI
ncbi:Phr family secreted Rap phosphatase inhibitor [Bacillus pseudomycoides]|uniref:Phr family secreted Rap phosphatase inhibitor n=1 Tax=Bacillus pseudomycoides TaxID=64104 RepID=A0AA91VDE3_9BACI|nr:MULTISPECIES: Phr family secreted Rap phosphatase inhibitor [Bacillus]PEB51428.1 Phr family secreted Rap phosphatase inhibitor [Bacillus sp. AFS098217]PED82608.1 Phr family secreted Rap phosphatase inhibitor [Bacillus pseudomycoides]PEU12102.1 Phr family secreted Rap phosphatase inhibitor [Bacillus sp. AFS014408]PEU17714.1 Phr family secreted Rap phosphatase inhibitor [Bacillus sp. AFS019443]PFW60910.1 Phr family secreted Rap phosphatase inhibitor [Bacillus sp. AFS075034]